MAVSLEPRANRRTGARVNQIPPDKATPVPRGAGAPLGTSPRKNRAAGGVTVLATAPAPPRLGAPAPRRPTHGATRAVLLLLAAGRGSEQGRRWAAPVVLRSLAARSASASGWAALGGHAGLNGPREERRASALLPFSERSPTSRLPARRRRVLPRSSRPPLAGSEWGRARLLFRPSGEATCPLNKCLATNDAGNWAIRHDKTSLSGDILQIVLVVYPYQVLE